MKPSAVAGGWLIAVAGAVSAINFQLSVSYFPVFAVSPPVNGGAVKLRDPGNEKTPIITGVIC
jgi:hypothetical protein